MKYTLDTDFSSLNGPKAVNWIIGFQDMTEDAFADSSSHSRLLGNLLILEPYLHTIRQGLADRCRTVPAILQEALDILWDYLEGRKAPSDFQDFANNLYAAALDYSVGEEITDKSGAVDLNSAPLPTNEYTVKFFIKEGSPHIGRYFLIKTEISISLFISLQYYYVRFK